MKHQLFYYHCPHILHFTCFEEISHELKLREQERAVKGPHLSTPKLPPAGCGSRSVLQGREGGYRFLSWASLLGGV
jgi:hypothetical protein